jgi:hypothetical protein
MVTNKVNILLCDENINEKEIRIQKKHKDHLHSYNKHIYDIVLGEDEKEECPNLVQISIFILYSRSVFEQWNFYGWFLRFLNFISLHTFPHT